ncbi:MAG: hypothetical protein DWQ06_10945 [Calditrichaeota bacterium]|nr:MAG: hypothetical protein DWQ06_10945 [Calditrichota bacterium]
MKIFLTILFSFLIISCDGPFPAQDKIGVPSDHTESKEGALHKPGYENPFSNKSDCSSPVCHQQNLQGGFVTEQNQVPPSCYQCHGVKWND